VETVLHIDGRIVQTLPPLLLKPGFLTLEYFAGRRVPYIAPFRLMFVLCLLSFFVVHLAINQFTSKIDAHGLPVVSVNSNAIETARTPADVREALQDQLDGLEAARQTGVLPAKALERIDNSASELRQKASRRLVELGAAPMAASSLAAPLSEAEVGTPRHRAKKADVATKPSGGESKPVQINWLPEAVNAHLTELGHRMHNNWRTMKDSDDPVERAEAKQRMINGVFSKLPASMFILIPVFAGLLKLFYVFRRRLYMEHLIVALHSHAFMFLALLLITLTGMLSTWLRPHAAWTGTALGWVQAALILWIPAYLLLMQKRMYHQGWPMTVLKFWFIGWCYFWLLTFALIVAAALGMAH
jgi:hypothetical protein